MDKSDLKGKLFKDFTGPFLYVKPSYDMFDDSVVVERINSEGYVMGNYVVMSVDQFESDSYELLGEYAGLEQARAAVAEYNGNSSPLPDN